MGLYPPVNKVINIPGVTVPDTVTSTVFAEITIVLPDVKLVFDIVKLGLIVYADDVYNVFPVKNPLGAAEL